MRSFPVKRISSADVPQLTLMFAFLVGAAYALSAAAARGDAHDDIRPVFSLAGIAATGAKGLRIPPGNLPPSARGGDGGGGGSWSASFALWLDLDAVAVEPPGDAGAAFRTLLFHGPGGGSQERTPSAWLAPGSRRLLLRASRYAPAYEPDVGAESVSPLPARAWVHVALVFTNHSQRGGAAAGRQQPDASGDGAVANDELERPRHTNDKTPPLRAIDSDDTAAPAAVESTAAAPIYTMELWLDGTLDTRLTYHAPGVVGANDGPLWVGASEGFRGLPALVAGLQLYEGGLTGADIASLHACAQRLLQLPGGRDDEAAAADANEDSARGPLCARWPRWPRAAFSDDWHGVAQVMHSAARATAWLSAAGTAMDAAGSQPRYSRGPAEAEAYRALQMAPQPPEAGTSAGSAAPGTGSSAAASGEPDPVAAAVARFNDCGTPPADVTRDTVQLCRQLLLPQRQLEPPQRPAAARMVAEWLLQPGRDHCGAEELRRAGHGGGRLARALRPLTATAAALLRAVRRPATAGDTPSSPAALVADTVCAAVASHRRDVPAARALLIRAAAGGDAAALYRWAVLLLTGAGPQAPPPPLPPPGVDSGGGENTHNTAPGDVGDTDYQSFATGLLHLAAVRGEPRAWAALARLYRTDAGPWDEPDDERYRTCVPLAHLAAAVAADPSAARRYGGRAVRLCPPPPAPVDAELASWYYEWAADTADAAFNARGGQPLHEAQRLSASTADAGDVVVAQRGYDDPAIADARVRADGGDVAAQTTLAELCYWGARGLRRDHECAFRYWRAAAEVGGSAPAAVAAANMIVRGEAPAGEPGVDGRLAVALYERAAAATNDTRALNGLGYAHFHGLGGVVPVNRTAARLAFLAAAAQRADGDSLFNAGMCLLRGDGGPADAVAATALLDDGAHAFGHFASVQAVGRQWAWGTRPAGDAGAVTGVRDATAATRYLAAAAAQGPWGALLRRGFDRYLAAAGGTGSSGGGSDARGGSPLPHYLEAHLLGHPVATSNAAYLLSRGWGCSGRDAVWGSERARAARARVLHQQAAAAAATGAAAAAESVVPFATHLLAGTGGLVQDVPRALRLLREAAAVPSGGAAAAAAYALAAEAETGCRGTCTPDADAAAAWYAASVRLAEAAAAAAPTAGNDGSSSRYAAGAAVPARLALARLAAARYAAGVARLPRVDGEGAALVAAAIALAGVLAVRQRRRRRHWQAADGAAAVAAVAVPPERL
jgi:hypothetical protein